MSDSSAILPPIGQLIGVASDEGKAVAYLTDLARESLEAAQPWIDQAASNLQIYTYGKDPTPASTDVISNAIQDDIAAITDQQTKEPPVTKIQPVERGEPGPIYRMDMPTPPLDPAAVAMATTPHPMTDPATGQPTQGAPAEDPAVFVSITDELAADFYQKQFDAYWARGRIDAALRRSVLYTNIYGYLFPLYEWRSDERKPKLHTNISLKQIYVDPTVDVIDDAQYAGVDWWIDMLQAQRMFPQIAAQIEQEATRGQPIRPDSSTQLGFNVDHNFRRNNVVLRIFWLRNQMCPMTPEMAVAGGHVEQRLVPVQNAPSEEPNGAQVDSGTQAVQDQGQSDAGAVPGVDRPDGLQPDVGTAPSAGPGDAGGGDNLPPPLVQPTRVATFLTGTDAEVDAEVTPDHPDWPTYTCIRQITVVKSFVVDDRECPYLDIPLLHNVATHIPAQLYGQGLPQRLKSMQDGRNRALTNMVEHTDLYAHPVRIYPQSAWDKLPEKYKKEGASIGGMNVIIEDETFRQLGGKVQVAEQPEPMAPALVQLQEILKGELNERAATPEVTQGKTPEGVTGWQSIQLLQQAAQSRFGFSIQWTADMVYRLSQFLLHSLVTQLDTPNLLKVDSRYPTWIVDAIRAKAQAWYTDGGTIDIDVSVSSGTGMIKARKKAEASELLKTVDPITNEPAISMETFRERVGEDNEQEAQRNQQALQKVAMMQAAAAAQAGANAPEKKGGGGQAPAGNT